jgi:hypothetical protein
MLFVAFLDYLFKREGLVRYLVKAYADDLLFVTNNQREATEVITKLEKMSQYLDLNKEKVESYWLVALRYEKTNWKGLR